MHDLDREWSEYDRQQDEMEKAMRYEEFLELPPPGRPEDVTYEALYHRSLLFARSLHGHGGINTQEALSARMSYVLGWLHDVIEARDRIRKQKGVVI